MGDGDGGVADARLTDGRPAQSCTGPEACGGSACVDGYCCDTTCDRLCERCDQPGSEGLCTATAFGTDPDNECGGYQCGNDECAGNCTEASCKSPSHDCVEGVCQLRRPRQEEVATGLESETTITLTVTAPTLPGNTLVLTASLATTGQSISSIADSAGNTWTRAVLALPATNAYPTSEIWYASDAASITSLTVTPTEPRDATLHLTEWTGLEIVGLLEDSAVNPGANGTEVMSGPVDVAESSEAVVIAAMGYYASELAVLDDTTGFTDLLPVSLVYLNHHSAYQVAGPGTYEAHWSVSGAVNWTAGAIALRAR